MSFIFGILCVRESKKGGKWDDSCIRNGKMSKMWAHIYEGSFICDAYLPELQGKRAGGKKDFGSYLEEVEIALYDLAKVFDLNYISLQ